MSFASCIVMMSGYVLGTRCLFLDLVSDAVFVDLKYDNVLSFCRLLSVGGL